MIENLLKMLDDGRDSALLRFTLGNEYLKQNDTATACLHFAKAVELDPEYSAAWKLYAKALTEAGDSTRAREAYRRGIEVAEHRGDKQAAKEMSVFLRRLEKLGD